jgi:hypothetical protein
MKNQSLNKTPPIINVTSLFSELGKAASGQGSDRRTATRAIMSSYSLSFGHNHINYLYIHHPMAWKIPRSQTLPF